MVVEVALNVGGIDLGCKAQRVHEVLPQRRRRLGFLVQNVVNIVGHALEHLEDVLDGALEGLEVGDDGL